MRVAHIITRLILGGAQENTLLCCEDLMRDYGDEVLLITGPPIGPEGSLLDRARASKVPLAIVPALRRAIHPWRDLRSYYDLRRLLQDYRPDVVHTHSAKGGLLGRAAAWSLGTPAIIHTVHGAPFHPYQNRVSQFAFAACERWAARRCHAMISVADAMTQLMVRASVAPNQMFTTIYSGLEVEPFLAAESLREKVRRDLGYRSEHVVIGKIARLFHLKGHEYLIEAARTVVAVRPNIRFLLVGDGVLRQSLERQIVQAGLCPYFQFTGLVPPQQIPGLLAAMDGVVHVSLREGLARVLPQALLTGRPVISYDIDGAREVVIPNETGWLLPPPGCSHSQSISFLAESILQLADNPNLRERLGSEGRRRFAEIFRHQRMTAQIRQLYTSELTRKHGGRL